MGTAPTPPGLIEKIMQKVDERIARFARSGFLRNATISDGGITVKNGFIRVRNADDSVSTLFVGGITPTLPDGSLQPGVIMRREDGTLALALYDPVPSEGDFHQFLALYDRGQRVIVSDDTDSGQGLARPYLGTPFHRDRFADWVTTTSSSFETLHSALTYKQHPNLYVSVWGSNDTSGATGEVRILVNGDPWGPVGGTGFVVATEDFGPLPVPGDHMAPLLIQVQARRATGTGGVRVEPRACIGMQS